MLTPKDWGAPMKPDKSKLTEVLVKKPTIRVGRFADDDAKAAA